MTQYQPLVKGNPRPIGAGGLPVAFPYFGKANGRFGVEDEIRHRRQTCLCDYPSGPNVPLHWFHAGNGWVGHYFYDVQPFDWTTQSNGVFKCQVRLPDGRLCDHQVVNDGCCDGNCCWCPKTTAVQMMITHLASHGISAPPTNGQWATELCDTESCLDVICCAPCQGSRQMMALSGYTNEFNWCWCLFFTFLGCRSEGHGRHQVVYWVPPWVYIACFTRYSVVKLQRIDEGFCTTCFTAWCCSVCSVAQTYREFSVAGVWPGGKCNDQPPSCCNVPRPQLMGLPIAGGGAAAGPPPGMYGGQQQGQPIYGGPVQGQVYQKSV